MDYELYVTWEGEKRYTNKILKISGNGTIQCEKSRTFQIKLKTVESLKENIKEQHELINLPVITFMCILAKD